MAVGEIGLQIKDIFLLVSLVLFLIISWTFRILAQEEDQYSYVYKIYTKVIILSIALK